MLSLLKIGGISSLVAVYSLCPSTLFVAVYLLTLTGKSIIVLGKNMFMEIGTAIIGLVLIAIVVVPFLMISKGKKREKKRMLHLLTTEANRVKSTITEYESCGNVIIGIDQEAGMVFFVKTKGDDYFPQAVNLADFRSCEVVAKNRSRGGASNDSVIDKLELLFKSATSGKADLALEFYNGAESFQVNDELTVMKRWAKTINNELLVKA